MPLSRYASLIPGQASQKTHQIPTINYHAIAIYVQQTNMPFKCSIYQLDDMQISDTYVSIFASYELIEIISVTTSSGIHTFTL